MTLFTSLLNTTLTCSSAAGARLHWTTAQIDAMIAVAVAESVPRALFAQLPGADQFYTTETVLPADKVPNIGQEPPLGGEPLVPITMRWNPAWDAVISPTIVKE